MKIHKRFKWRYISIACCIFLLFYELNENHRVELHISSAEGKDLILTMPWKDKKNIDFLLKEVLLTSGLYTLFGSKPMSMGNFITPFSMTDWRIFLCSLFPKNLRVYWGWKTWQKYAHLLDESQFLLWTEENPFWSRWSPLPNPSISILLLNKPQFEKAINTHIRDFQTVLNRDNITAEQLLLERQTRPLLKEVLKDHDGLIGTLFGYGRNNAWSFEARNHGIKVDLAPVWEQEIYDFFETRSSPNWLIYGLGPQDLSEMLIYPTFLAQPDSKETKEIKKKFLETREKIIAYYKGKDFVEASFNLLINGVSQNL